MWTLEVAITILILVAIQLGIRTGLARLEKQQQKGWKAQLPKILKQPLCVLVWVVGGLYVVDVVGANLEWEMGGYVRALQKTAVVVGMVWVLARWKGEVGEGNVSVKMVGRLVSIVVVLVAALVVLQIFGIDATPLLTFSGVGAAAFGLASKDVIANFCSGIMLHATRPFLIGEQVLVPEKGLEGVVEEVGWMRTLIRDKEKRCVSLPNNLFSTLLLVNVSRMTHRRVKQVLRVRFGEVGKLVEVTGRMREYLAGLVHIDGHLPVQVALKGFGDSACEVDVDAYSNVTDLGKFNAFQQEVLVDLAEMLKGAGIEMASPEVCIKQV